MEKELPKDWIETELSSILKLKNGFAFKSNEYKDEGIPVIRISDIQDGNIILDNAVCVDEFEKGNDFIVENGDILIAMSGATTGKFGIYGGREKVYQNQRVGNLKPLVSNTNKKFIYYLIGNLRKEIEEKAYGGAQPNISAKLIEEIKVHLPPLPEQERIVAKLDTLFAHLKQTKKRLEQIPVLLKQFRQAVLTQVYSTPFDRSFLKDCTLKIQDGAHHSPKVQYSEFRDGLYPYITSKNIRNNYMDLSNVVYVDREYHMSIYPRCKPELGDVLLTKDGANTGNVTLNTFDCEFSLLSSVCLIKTDNSLLSPSYLKYYIQSPQGLSELLGEMTGTAIKRIVLHKIKNATIPLPPIEEQTEIVRRVESLFAKADAIEARYKVLKELVDKLPQAILGKAFRGEV